jgi:hypothetical protein
LIVNFHRLDKCLQIGLEDEYVELSLNPTARFFFKVCGKFCPLPTPS